MNIDKVLGLKQGDKVFWNDPADELNNEPMSRWYEIDTIRIWGLENMTEEERQYEIEVHTSELESVTITEKEGSVLECYIWELSDTEPINTERENEEFENARRQADWSDEGSDNN